MVKVLDGSLGQLKVDSAVLVEDAKFFSPAYYGKLVKPYALKNVISLQINESALVPLQSAFTATVRLRINYVLNDSTSHTLDQDFTVTYDSTGTYNQKSNFTINNASRVEVKVLTLTKNVSWDVWRALKVVNQLQSYPQYVFSCSANAIQTIQDSVLPSNTTSDELPVYWAPSVGADEYDLEWAYVDSAALASGIYGSPSNPSGDLIFDNNATRVTITGTAYRIPLIYDDKGHLFFRVRPVQWQANGGRNEANWSSLYTGGLGRFNYDGHERSLNWQVTSSYAEEGKRKTVVQYFDGSLRMRQVVTKDNSTNTTLVAETFYDYQGRPTVQVLPAPTLSNIINYSRNFNVAFNSNIYDKYNYDTLTSPDVYCSMAAAPMDSISGASNYYSSLNPLKNTGIHRNIPNANGYPFAETEYTQDNTGRVSRQSAVGENFRLGSGHESKYYYGTPDQRELDALFGTEVGHYSHYTKTMLRDANGQYSISYVDMHGRTVATALAGTPPTDIKLDQLASNVAASRTENLSDPAATVIKDLVMENKKGLLVSTAGTHFFTYKLDPLSLQKEGCNAANVCYDCLYDLQITITDDCNNQKLGGAPFDTLIRNFSLNAIDTSCSNAPSGFSVSFAKFLTEGSYEITKKLSVSRVAMDYYRDSVFMKKNTCKSLNDFFQEQRQILAGVTQCKPSCQSCKDSIGTWAQFWARYRTQSGIADVDTAIYKNGAMEAYSNALADCKALCDSLTEDDDIRQAMLLDLTPSGGQYANLDNENDVLSVFFSSIDGTDPDTTAKYHLVTNYLDADGNPDLVFDETAGKLVAPQELSPEVFAQKFKLSWAEALLPYHPEYCKLQRYEMLNPSHEWDRRFGTVDTYAEALAKGYLNPIGESSFPSRFNGTAGQIDRDPLGTLQSGTFYNKLRDSILQYRNISALGNISLWGVATATIMCQTNTDNTTCYSTYSSTAHAFEEGTMCSGDLDMAWRAYRQMYLDIKRSIINKYWIQPGCSSSLTAAALVTAGHQPHFSDAVELQQASGGTFPQTQSEANSYQQQNQDQVNAYYASNCEAFASQWWQQLKPCSFTTADSARIVSRLVAVCKEGADQEHPFGASTVKPGSTYRFKSFDEFLSYYADSVKAVYNDNNCNLYLITDPPPYDRPKIYSDLDVWSKPSDCQCSLITKLNQRYQANHAGYASFVDYVNGRYSVTMTATDLQTLLDMCTGANTCKFLSKAITIPAPLQCGSEMACITCTDMANTYAKFLSDYPNAYIIADDDTTLRKQQYYTLFTNYFNAKLGFKKTYADYEAFLQQCTIPYYPPSTTAPSLPGSLLPRPATGGASVTGVSCDTLQSIVSGFNSLYPAAGGYTHVTITKMQILRPWLSYLLSCSGITKTYPTQKTPYPPLWRGSALRDSGYSSLWFRNNMTFVKYNLWELPHTITIDSVNLKMAPYLAEPFDTLMFWASMTTTWDTTLSCGQLGASYFGFATQLYKPLYKYNSPQGNQINVYNCKNQYLNLIRNPWGYKGDILHSIFNPRILAQNNATFIGFNHPLAQSDPETSPRLEVWFRKDTLYQCRDLVAAYFNYRLNSNLTYDSLVNLYQQKCGGTFPLACGATNDNLTLCDRKEPVFPRVQLEPIDNCSDSTFFITSKGTELYNAYVDSLENNFDSSYRARCLQAYKYEKFTVTHGVSEYHYTLFYYDQAGNLVKTVPPEGVHPRYDSLWLDSVQTARLADQVKLPAHTLATQYRYNTLNTSIAQKTPDNGVAEYWYDRLGRLTISRNARQKAASASENNRLYSYTLYDIIGRVTEVGEIKNATTLAMHDSISRNPVYLGNWLAASTANKSSVTQTVYDVAYTGFAPAAAPVVQRNLRNRVSYVTYTLGNNPARYNQASFYTYDIHGNIDTLLQDYGSSAFAEVENLMNDNNNRFKKMIYQYDLISGKVNTMSYQPGQADQFYHRYSYDAENKLILAESSLDNVTWEKEARYEYYKHGALARKVIGDQQVQGVDYAYTLQGWMKGINSTGLSADYDMGADGKVGALNQYVARDAVGIALNYFAGDYKPIDVSVQTFPGYSAYLGTSYRPLYNGNISSISAGNVKFGSPLFYNYTYDQLNRLSGMDVYNNYNLSGNSWSSMALLNDYKERISYDANGNIMKYLRNGYGSNLTMDSLTYNYNLDAQGRLVNNQLTYVRDRVNNSTAHSGNYTVDVEDQAAGNYTYDAIGNLTSDVQEGITSITWNAYGKMTEIKRTATAANPVTDIQFFYDAGANRIGKRVEYNGASVIYTWYVRDASGNVVAVYNGAGVGIQYAGYSLSLKELQLYGSSRLGILNCNVDMKAAYNPTGVDSFVRGRKYYELTNHLGNVLATVSDKKKGREAGTPDGILDYYEADVVSASDYYPFGMQMPNRTFSAGNYRYGFNGKENDNEVKGSGNQQDYGMRIYDPRIGRFLSSDPLAKKYPELTPYQFASNTPLQAIDRDGAERLDMTNINAQQRTATITVVHTTQIVSQGLVPDVNNLQPANYQSRFRNTTVYVRDIPQNGQPLDFIRKKDYKRGVGYALNVVFDVNLVYVPTAAAAARDAAHSTVTMGPAAGFNGPNTFAHAAVNGTNTIEINPNFAFLAANNVNGDVMNENYEELLAHEAGFHNMEGLLHQPDRNGHAIYPRGTTLESNQHGRIKSNDKNVQQILRMNITTRQNLTGAPAAPAPAAAPAAPKPAAAPAQPAAIPEDDNSPDHMKINRGNGNLGG